MMVGRKENMVLCDNAMLKTTWVDSFIVSPTIEANNIHLWPDLIDFVVQNPFYCHHSEILVHTIIVFCRNVTSIKYSEVSNDAIRFRLSLFSLMDKAGYWLLNEEPNWFSTLDTLPKAFLSMYLCPNKITKLRMDVTLFMQQDRESLHETWEIKTFSASSVLD